MGVAGRAEGTLDGYTLAFLPRGEDLVQQDDTFVMREARGRGIARSSDGLAPDVGGRAPRADPRAHLDGRGQRAHAAAEPQLRLPGGGGWCARCSARTRAAAHDLVRRAARPRHVPVRGLAHRRVPRAPARLVRVVRRARHGDASAEARGWATLWRIKTADGVWFAKQNCPGRRSSCRCRPAGRPDPRPCHPVTAASDGFLLSPTRRVLRVRRRRPGELGPAGPRGGRLQRTLVPRRDESSRSG